MLLDFNNMGGLMRRVMTQALTNPQVNEYIFYLKLLLYKVVYNNKITLILFADVQSIKRDASKY